MDRISSPATATNHNIYKQYVTSEFTNLSNHSCQVRFKGDKKPSAKEVYHYLYSLPATWNISVENVARHFDVREKYMQEIFAIIIANDHMVAIRERYTNGRLGKIIYKVFPPQVEKRPVDANHIKQPEIKEKCEKQPQVEKRPMDTYIIQKKDLKKTITVPPPEPIPEPQPPEPQKSPKAVTDADDILNFRKQLPSEINFRISNSDLNEHLGISNEHIKWAVDQALKPWVRNKIGLFRSLCRKEMPPLPPPPPEPMEYNPDNDNHNNSHDAYKNLCDIDYGEHESKIREYCNKIKRFPKQKGVYYLPLGSCGAAMQGGATSITILRALEKTISNWDNIKDDPKVYFEKQCDKEEN